MNREQRRALSRGRGGQVWTQWATCTSCGDRILHVEQSPYDDEPHGMPDAPCSCGGNYVAPRRDLAAVGTWQS